MKKIVLENVKDFNIKHILECGQCFRWKREEDGSYTRSNKKWYSKYTYG